MKINQFLQKFTVPQYVQAVPLVVYEPVESHSGKHLPLYSHLGMFVFVKNMQLLCFVKNEIKRNEIKKKNISYHV